MALIVTDPRGTYVDDKGVERACDGTQRYHLYCCNDSMGTREVFDLLHPTLSPADRQIYDAQMAFLSPVLAMSLRGTLVDETARREALKDRLADEAEAIEKLRQHPQVKEVWDQFEPWKNDRDGFCAEGSKLREDGGKANHLWDPRGVDFTEQACKRCGAKRAVITPLNPQSPKQMVELIYGKLGLQKRYDRKSGKLTTKDEALDALANKYPEWAPLLDCILDARGAHKQVALLQTRLDPDNRWRSSFNVGAAETGRMSSSKSPYRTGGNMQNVADSSRNIFVADPGLVMFYADLEQAESRIVANDAECAQDIEDHASGDTHTGLAVNIFPGLPWSLVGGPGACPVCGGGGRTRAGKACKPCDGTGHIKVLTEKLIAGTPLPWDPEHDHRHVAKIVRHGTNIGMTHVGISRELHCTQREAKGYRQAYFDRYPENLRRQQEIRAQVREQGYLTTPMGRTRLFLGRPWDEDTMKEALAQTQQSCIADVLNVAMWRIWWELDTRVNIGSAPKASDPNKVWLLGQIHDAVLGLIRPGDDETLLRIKQILETPVLVRDKPVIIPAEVMIGPNWRKNDLSVWKH